MVDRILPNISQSAPSTNPATARPTQHQQTKPHPSHLPGDGTRGTETIVHAPPTGRLWGGQQVAGWWLNKVKV